MDNNERTITEWIEHFDNGDFESPDVSMQIDAGWYDWFCKDTSLRNKTRFLGKHLKTLIGSPKFDPDKTYVFFKNNCPVVGTLYDDFRICDIETGDVLYTVTPRSGHSGEAEVHGCENGFDGPLAKGTWKDIKKFFEV